MIPNLGAGGWENKTRDAGLSLICGESSDFPECQQRCHEGPDQCFASQ